MSRVVTKPEQGHRAYSGCDGNPGPDLLAMAKSTTPLQLLSPLDPTNQTLWITFPFKPLSLSLRICLENKIAFKSKTIDLY